MPASLTAIGDRTLLWAAGVAALLLIVVSILLSPNDETSSTPTTYSVGSGGAKAAYLLLQEGGYPVRRWEQSALELPIGDASTLILAQPGQPPTTAERAAIRQFIEHGGRVIATGVVGAYFLPEGHAEQEAIAGITWRRLAARAPSSVTRAAPQITLAPEAYWDTGEVALRLYSDDNRARVITYQIGRGEAAWWASATPLTNAGLSEPGNLEFFLASIGDRSRPILWDEYVHGHRPQGAGARAPQGLRWIGLQLALLAAAVLVTHSRRSSPAIAAPADSRLSPLEFVRTLGSLYRRAGAASIAVDISYQRFRYQLTRQLAVPVAVSNDELDRAVRARWRFDDPAFAVLLRECDSARLDARLAVPKALRLTQSLFDWSIKFGLRESSRKEHS